MRMERRRFGPSDLEITPVGIGTAPIGSSPDWWVWWGRQDPAESIRAVHAALDAGVNWIDTAPFYGWGRAEEIVGRAIRGREDALVFTKCGTMRRENGDDFMDLRPAAIRSDVEDSLRRLGIVEVEGWRCERDLHLAARWQLDRIGQPVAAAPFRAYTTGTVSGSRSARRSPLDGEARLNSAIKATPGRRSIQVNSGGVGSAFDALHSNATQIQAWEEFYFNCG